MRVSLSRSAFEMLERCALKKARTVLRGLRISNDPRLPDPLPLLTQESKPQGKPIEVKVKDVRKSKGHLYSLFLV